MTLKPYPKYKPSGVEWLGEVPEHWEVKKLSYWISRYGSGTTPSLESHYSEEGIPWVTTGELRENVILSTVKSVTNIAVENISALTIHPKGSLLIAMYGATVGRVAVLGVHATLNQACFAIHPNAALTIEFLNYWFQGFRKDLIALATGAGQPNVSADKILSLLIPAPVSNEQTTIANFLDRETTRIDNLISKQQRMIELLKEKRQAVISHAVTKGLDPTVKMKESGVEWLGEVPEHWKMSKLKYYGESIIGLTYSPNDIVDESSGGVLVLRSSNVQNGKIVLDNNVYVRCDVPDKLRTRKGDILICSRNGSRALIGKNAMVDSFSEGNTFGAFMTVFRSRSFNFIYWILNSSLFSYQSGTFLTSTINQLTTGNLNSFEIPVPSVEEQLAIANYLDNQTTKFDALIEKANQAIELLKERRMALISAAVTGKVDVREMA